MSLFLQHLARLIDREMGGHFGFQRFHPSPDGGRPCGKFALRQQAFLKSVDQPLKTLLRLDKQSPSILMVEGRVRLALLQATLPFSLETHGVLQDLAGILPDSLF